MYKKLMYIALKDLKKNTIIKRVLYEIKFKYERQKWVILTGRQVTI